MRTLLQCLKPGHGGVLTWELYAVARAGTKRDIEGLTDEARASR